MKSDFVARKSIIQELGSKAEGTENSIPEVWICNNARFLSRSVGWVNGPRISNVTVSWFILTVSTFYVMSKAWGYFKWERAREISIFQWSSSAAAYDMQGDQKEASIAMLQQKRKESSCQVRVFLLQKITSLDNDFVSFRDMAQSNWRCWKKTFLPFAARHPTSCSVRIKVLW